MLRCANRAKCRTFIGFMDALQYQTADTFCRFFDSLIRQAESPFSIEDSVIRPQPQPTLRNRADTAPFARHNLEHLADDRLRRFIAGPAHRAAVLILD